MKAIRDLFEPGNGVELMRFLGLGDFFSVIVDHSAEIARPLYAVLKCTCLNPKKKCRACLFISDWDCRWGSCQRTAKEDLKKVLGDQDVLASPRRGAAKKVHDGYQWVRTRRSADARGKQWKMETHRFHKQEAVGF